jgi:Xaa-Pro aminopeptidase
MGHYFRAAAPLRSGDLVLLDYAPEYRYYTSDITRVWPVNGKYTTAQRQLCSFILAYRNALLKRTRGGAHPQRILDEAAAEMAEYLKSAKWENASHQRAAEAALKFRGHLQHPVGMAVHDVGTYTNAPLEPGMVFSIDPMLWVPEEKLYVRMEDVVAVTGTGVEVFTDFMPSTPDEIERFMQTDGMLQKFPPSPGTGSGR